jgi:hypothetical protein
MTLLCKNLALNNVISSSMLENLKLVCSMKHHTPFHQYLQLNYSNNYSLLRFIERILAVKPESKQEEGEALPQSHLRELE